MVKAKKQSLWQDKDEWEGYRVTEEYNILGCSTIQSDVKRRVTIYKTGLYESPKTYDRDGFAYNDGSWLIYNTCRITDGKFRNKIACRTKDDVIRYSYGYLCFLRKVGIVERLEMRYNLICYVINKLAIPKGVFDKTDNNKKELDKIVMEVLNKDIDSIKCCRYDDRKFCMDPSRKKMMNTRQKTTLQRKKDKEMNYDRIMELYDASKTYDQNVFNMKRQGIDICNKTLRNVLKDRKVK